MTSIIPNGQRLLRALVTDGPTYRADLARTLDVTRATVTNLTQTLAAGGWVSELESEPHSLKALIGTTPSLGLWASVMYLVDTCTVVVAHLDGRVLNELTVSTDPGLRASARLREGQDLVARLLTDEALPESALRGIHLAVDTQMDATSGEIYAERASRRWYGVNPKTSFEERFGVPVHVQNTARLEGLAEYVWGVGRANDNMLYIEVSHGVTSGHIMGGVIASGARGGSGELGHMVYDWNGPICTCGNPGCVMQYVSIPALLRDHANTTGDQISWPQFVALAHDGDAATTAISERAATILGRAIVNVCHLIDPETVVLSGEVAGSLPGFIDRVAATVREGALPLIGRNLRVLPARLDDKLLATARAGIESLRRRDDLITSVTAR